MSNRKSRLLILAIWMGWGVCGWPSEPNQAVKEEAEEKIDADYTLTFSSSAAPPGGEAVLSLFFTRRPGAPNIRQIRVRLTYPNSIVDYQKLEEAYLGRRADLQVKAKSISGADEGLVELVFALPQTSEKDFPSGQLAYLHFMIFPNATDGAVVLKPALWIDEKPASDLPARLEEGKISVASTPVFVGCFLFTH